jgi:ribosomal-protein-alanine N-acetyltransferase
MPNLSVNPDARSAWPRPYRVLNCHSAVERCAGVPVPCIVRRPMIADVAIRLATPADAVGIASMSRDYIEHAMPWRWRRNRVIHAMRSLNTNVAVVDERSEIAGFGVMSYGDDYAHLQLFAVRPSSQRKGIGSAILIWLETVARFAGARRIYVEARRENSAARCFYNEHGYHEHVLEKRMYSGRLDGVRLEKWLQDA